MNRGLIVEMARMWLLFGLPCFLALGSVLATRVGRSSAAAAAARRALRYRVRTTLPSHLDGTR